MALDGKQLAILFENQLTTTGLVGLFSALTDTQLVAVQAVLGNGSGTGGGLTGTSLTAEQITAINSVINNTFATQSQLGMGLSGKADLVNGVISASQLPGFVDDVLEFADESSFPTPGESGKLYIATDVNQSFRWSGSQYVRVDANGVALGFTSATAYPGDKGQANADAIQALQNATFPTPSTRIAYVSPVGDDATGAVSDSRLPFQTIGAANAATLANDVIELLPGSYTETAELLGTRIYFCNYGVTLNNCRFTVQTGSQFIGHADVNNTEAGATFTFGSDVVNTETAIRDVVNDFDVGPAARIFQFTGSGNPNSPNHVRMRDGTTRRQSFIFVQGSAFYSLRRSIDFRFRHLRNTQDSEEPFSNSHAVSCISSNSFCDWRISGVTAAGDSNAPMKFGSPNGATDVQNIVIEAGEFTTLNAQPALILNQGNGPRRLLLNSGTILAGVTHGLGSDQGVSTAVDIHARQTATIKAMSTSAVGVPTVVEGTITE